MSSIESHRFSKRKLDDYDHDINTSSLTSPKMRTNHNKDKNKEKTLASTSSSSSSTSSSSSSFNEPIQFFVTMLSGSPVRTLVLHGHLSDTVEFIHNRIHSLTGIPSEHQRLIFQGKQLQWDKTLAHYSLQKDSSLHLVARLRSTSQPLSFSLLDSIISLILSLIRSHLPPSPSNKKLLLSNLSEFLSATPKIGGSNSSPSSHFEIFLSSSAPTALVMLYISTVPGNRQTADDAIRHFVSTCKRELSKAVHPHVAMVLLRFCHLLSSRSGDGLYAFCRSTLGSMIGSVRGGEGEEGGRVGFHDVFRFVRETSVRVGKELDGDGVSREAVEDFSAFLSPVLEVVKEVVGVIDPRGEKKNFSFEDDIVYLYGILNILLIKIDVCLRKVEEEDKKDDRAEAVNKRLSWCYYLPVLKELWRISKCFRNAEEVFWTKMERRKVALTYLIVTYTRRDAENNNAWLLGHKEALEFESRRHLVMMMLPDTREDYDELHEMLIDREHMLAESFEYIGRADPEALKSGLFMEFKHEEATGPGVLREWFFLVCQKIFNPENALFVACPNDRRRFFPNHVSRVHPSGIGLEYFGFAGRVIALALMHKLQIGIVFDRVFFLQLAGKKVTLEDICDADPCMYSSCKKILELDADIVDSDALGLTFVREVEELGARTIVELCPGGKGIAVNSVNRQAYVDRLIEHRFVESIKEQVQCFAKGFADMLIIPGSCQLFFQSLELQDLDWMLHGSEIAISVEDWMAHTEYNGFKVTDPQICWFWKIVGEMSSEQKKVLLFFWTSLKCLPVEGFCGLSSRLYIYKSSESLDRLPSSHTCFYRICFPAYPSMDVMQDRLNIITQEHVSCSFGTW